MISFAFGFLKAPVFRGHNSFRESNGSNFCPFSKQKPSKKSSTGMSMVLSKWITLQEINMSHLGKRKIIFKYAVFGGYGYFSPLQVGWDT